MRAYPWPPYLHKCANAPSRHRLRFGSCVLTIKECAMPGVASGAEVLAWLRGTFMHVSSVIERVRVRDRAHFSQSVCSKIKGEGDRAPSHHCCARSIAPLLFTHLLHLIPQRARTPSRHCPSIYLLLLTIRFALSFRWGRICCATY